MAARDTSSVGAPCWVDTWQPDPRAAKDFYGQLFGWTFDDPVPMPSVSTATTTARAFAGSWWPASGRPRRSLRLAGSPTSASMTSGESLARAERAGGKRLGPADDGPEARFAVLADPAGVPFCLRQSGAADGVELADEPNCWAMSSLHAPTWDRPRPSTEPCSAGSSKRCLTLPFHFGSSPTASWPSWRPPTASRFRRIGASTSRSATPTPLLSVLLPWAVAS